MIDLYKRLRHFAADKPKRDKEYLRRIKILWPQCANCGKPTDDPHHVFGSYMSLKTSDLATIGTCRECNGLAETDQQVRQDIFRQWVIWIIVAFLKGRLVWRDE